ncbi:hypothetical protein BGX20_005790, partial [Mortierella sp. AD010]
MFLSWDVGAHFFVSEENSASVTSALKIIRKWEPNWQPRYMLSDQSSIENKSINMAFPGITRGEQNCDVILCSVHIMRTWKLKIYVKETEAKMIQAMHNRTQIGCDALIEDTIATCPVSPVAKYVRTYHSNNTEKWAFWARQHSPLLLQVTSTNALESYHSELKRLTRASFGI